MHPTIPLTIWASENIRTLSEVFGKDRENDLPFQNRWIFFGLFFKALLAGSRSPGSALS